MTLLPENPAETAYEAELIQRIKSGEHDLFYRLIQPYERRVYAAALAIVRNEADAEDIAQDSILKALRHLSQFRGEAKFSSWLLQITINEARMRKRRMTLRAMESISDQQNDEGRLYAPRIRRLARDPIGEPGTKGSPHRISRSVVLAR